MIRVLNVISGLNNAGTEAVVMNYYRHMDRTKIQFDFLVLNTEKAYYEEEILNMGGRIFKMPSFRKSPVRCMKARKKFFKTHHYDIVEVHSPSALRYAYCKIAKKSGVKSVIFHVHSSCEKNGVLIKYARRQIEKYCDQTVTCSQIAAINVLGKKADKIVYNAIDYNKYKFDENNRQKIRNHFDIGEKTKLIGYIGRFSLIKSPIFLLEAFAKAAFKDESIILMMKGFGEMESEIKHKIRELKLDTRVIFCGQEFEANEVYSALDVFVLPSKIEGLGVVVIEAQANGLYSLCSKNVPMEVDLGNNVTFINLKESEWEREFLNYDNYNRIPKSFDFLQTEYVIERAAMERQNEYLEMIVGK